MTNDQQPHRVSAVAPTIGAVLSMYVKAVHALSQLPVTTQEVDVTIPVHKEGT